VDFEDFDMSYSAEDERSDGYKEILGLLMSLQFVSKLGTLWNMLALLEVKHQEFR
jgi:hypothetical protein